jgi:multidrug resistance efflux pump
MKNNNPIPIPFRQRWLDFKVIYLPLIVFLTLCLAVIWIWGRVVAPTSIVGEVEAIRANVQSPVPGTLVSLNVTRMQRVTNGECVAVMSSFDPAVASNELAAIAADLNVMRSRMAISEAGNVSRLSEIRINLLDQQLQLALAKVRLEQAENELKRAQQLFKEALIPSGGDTKNTLEIAQRDRDLYVAEVDHRKRLVEQCESEIKTLSTLGVVNTNSILSSIDQAIDAEKRRFDGLNQRIALRAPIDGYVSSIRCQAGERINAESPVMVIASENADRVIAWVRQPVTIVPKVGDTVGVRHPMVNNMVIPAKVIQVGGQFEPLSSGVMPMNFMSNRVETGLPFLAQLPKNSKLIPGEPVQLEIARRPRPEGSY